MTEAERKATNIVSDYLESTGKMCDDASIEREVNSWYINSDIADPVMLAAAVLEWGQWHMVSYNDWLDARNRWFANHHSYYPNTTN